jgi:hypothetical protein
MEGAEATMDAGMTIARMVGFAALGVAAVFVGVRMLQITWRTGQFPEAAIGTHMLVLMLGYGVEFAGVEAATALGPRAEVLRGLGNLCYAVAIFVSLLFAWRVFRPGSRAAGWVVACCGAALVVGWTGEALTSHFDFGRERFAAPWFWIAFLPRLVCMAWAAGEALHEYGLARRRLRLGLSDAVVANRFLMWGLATLAELGIYAVVMISILRGVPSDFLTGTSALVVSALGLSAAVTITLAFLPPRSYRRWLAS